MLLEITVNYNVLLAIAAIAGLNIASDASGTQDLIVVATKPITFARWSIAVTKRIEDHLVYPTYLWSKVPTGLVSVTFGCSEGGLPSRVSLARSSGDKLLDQAAMRAVKRIHTLHPMPSAFRSDQNFVANILFATDRGDYDRQLKILRADAARRSFSHARDGEPIALNIGSRTPAGL